MPNPTPTKQDYHSLAKESRLKVLDLVYKAQTSHIGSLMGAADLFAVVFSNIDLDKDKFILSAGWKAALLYFHLWRKGRITLEELDSYCQPNSKFIGLAEPIHPDIPFAGGSMGYGLPAAVGFALAKKLKGEEGKIYCYMSDGELQIGTTWEAAQIAMHHQLDNLIVLIEMNDLQAMGRTDDILFRIREDRFNGKGLDHSPFPHSHGRGWVIADLGKNAGHHFLSIEAGLEHPSALKGRGVWGIGRPKVIFFNTVKGRGVSFMENNNLYHYKALSKEEYEQAKQELEHV